MFALTLTAAVYGHFRALLAFVFPGGQLIARVIVEAFALVAPRTRLRVIHQYAANIVEKIRTAHVLKYSIIEHI